MDCGLSLNPPTSSEAPSAQLWPVGRSIASDLYGPAFFAVLQPQFPLLTGKGFLSSLNPV